MKNYEEILNELYAVLGSFSSENAGILTEETELADDLALDSVMFLEVMMEVEDRLEISIPLNVLPDVSTIKDLALKIQEVT